LQIEWNPCLGGYRPQIPVLSAVCPQLNFFNTSPTPNKKIPGVNTPTPKKIPGYDSGPLYVCFSPLNYDITQSDTGPSISKVYTSPVLGVEHSVTQQVSYTDSASALYSQGTQFEYRAQHQLSCIRVLP
jgi:hypothetical protein